MHLLSNLPIRQKQRKDSAFFFFKSPYTTINKCNIKIIVYQDINIFI